MKRMSLVVVLLVAVGLAASAQAGGDLGLLYKFDVAPSAWLSPNWSTFTIPSFHGVGVIYHVTDRLALMPTVFFGWGKLDYESGGSKTYDETLMAAGVEIDVPLYIKKSNNIRVFLAPGLRGVVGFFDYENLLDATDYEQTVYREVGARLNI